MTGPGTLPDTMPGPELLPGVSRTTAVDVVEKVRDLYADAERRIAETMAIQLARGIDAPQWATRKMEQAAAVRRQCEQILARLRQDTTHEVTYAIVSAFLRGGSEAAKALVHLGIGGPPHPDRELLALLDGPRSALTRGLTDLGRAFPGVAGMLRIIGALVLRITGTYLPVLRWVDDSYRKVIAEAALIDVTGGILTRRRASQKAWERLLDDGIDGFVDRSGRNWNLATYVEMATRAGAAQAAVEGHLDRLKAAGFDLVIVSNAPQECIKCRPWEGKVLSVAGPPGPRTIQVPSAIGDGLVTVHIAGNVAEAILAGLLHPNCRHSISAYLPGATRIPTHTQDPEGDAARQRLRHLERMVRKEKLKAAATIDPAAKRVHDAKARAWQGKIREHVAATEHLGIKRMPERERINLGHTRPPDPLGTSAKPPKPQPDPLFPPTGHQPAPPTPPAAVALPDLTEAQLHGLSDDELLDHFAQASAGDVADEALLTRLIGEMDRRENADKAPDWLDAPKNTSFDLPAVLTPEQRRIDDLVGKGGDYLDAYAEVYGADAATLARQGAASTVERRAGETLDQAIRRSYDEWVHVRYMDAEEATRGVLLSKAGKAAGVDPRSLFSGPLTRARKYASEELMRWWTSNDRLDFTGFKAQVLMRNGDVRAAKQARARSNGKDFL